MIKCDLGKVVFKGPKTVILAECSMLLSEVKNFLTEKYGEENAMRDMQSVWDTAFLSEEELKARSEETERELPPELKMMADMFVEILKTSNIQFCSVEEDEADGKEEKEQNC